jgi:AmmeMemoRadiSam system protein B
MSYVREMTHGGEWYPTDASLAKMMKASFFYAPVTAADKINVVGIISPHSCYTVCLRTAAKAYARVNPDNYDTVIVLGPSHHRQLTCCLVSDASVAKTPFGDLEIDRDSCKSLCESDPNLFTLMTKDVDDAEFSLEMQYPLIKWVFGERPVKLIPILVGSLNEEREAVVGTIIKPFLTADRALFVISSDFTHWGEIFRFTKMQNPRKPLSQQLKLFDEKAQNVIVQFNAVHFRFLIEEMNGAICGCYSIALVISALSRKRYTAATVDRSELYTLKTPKDFSISYVAMVFTRLEGDIPEEEEDANDLSAYIDPSLISRIQMGR